MNRIRRKSLRTILGQMDELSTVLETVKEALQDVLNEEQEAYETCRRGSRNQTEDSRCRSTSMLWRVSLTLLESWT